MDQEPVGALHPCGYSADPRCPYSAMCRLWWRDAAELSEEQRAVTPIFRHPDGSGGRRTCMTQCRTSRRPQWRWSWTRLSSAE